MGLSAPKRSANAVELTVDCSLVRRRLLCRRAPFRGCWRSPRPYRDPADRMAFTRRQTVELGCLGLTDRQTGRIDDTVADWIRLVCHPRALARTPLLARRFGERRHAAGHGGAPWRTYRRRVAQRPADHLHGDRLARPARSGADSVRRPAPTSARAFRRVRASRPGGRESRRATARRRRTGHAARLSRHPRVSTSRGAGGVRGAAKLCRDRGRAKHRRSRGRERSRRGDRRHHRRTSPGQPADGRRRRMGFDLRAGHTVCRRPGGRESHRHPAGRPLVPR